MNTVRLICPCLISSAPRRAWVSFIETGTYDYIVGIYHICDDILDNSRHPLPYQDSVVPEREEANPRTNRFKEYCRLSHKTESPWHTINILSTVQRTQSTLPSYNSCYMFLAL